MFYARFYKTNFLSLSKLRLGYICGYGLHVSWVGYRFTNDA